MTQPCFLLTAYDPNEPDWDEQPESLISLKDWYIGIQNGQLDWKFDLQEGVGLRINDGDRSKLVVSFGNPVETAYVCREAADRLAAGRVAALSSSFLDQTYHLILVPDGDFVQMVDCPDSQPPELKMSRLGTELYRGHTEQLPAFYRWIEDSVDEWMLPSGSPGHDAERGLGMACIAEELVSDLRVNAQIAHVVAEFVQWAPFGRPGAWTPIPLPADLSSLPALPSGSVPASPPSPSADQACAVSIRGFEPDVNKVSMIKLFRSMGGLEFDPARALFMEVAAGQSGTVLLSSAEAARQFSAAATQLGAHVADDAS